MHRDVNAGAPETRSVPPPQSYLKIRDFARSINRISRASDRPRSNECNEVRAAEGRRAIRAAARGPDTQH
jgi:hypothetical protein